MSSNSSRPGFVLKRRGLPSNHGLNSKSNLQDGMETTTTSKGSTFSSTKSSSIAYAHFSLQNQEIVSRQMPSDSSVDEIARAIERGWRSMTDDERQNWERASFNNHCDDNSEDQSQNKIVPLTRPKRPLSAYFFFAKEVRPKIKARFPSLGGNDVTKQIGLMWNKLSIAERTPYVTYEDKGKESYTQAMIAWNSLNRQKQQTAAVSGGVAPSHASESQEEMNDSMTDASG